MEPEVINEREAEKIEEWLARYEAAAETQQKAAEIIDAAVDQMTTNVENFGGYVRRLRDFS